MKIIITAIIYIFCLISCYNSTGQPTKTSKVKQKPAIEGAWWPIADNPDLGRYTTNAQQPVDFGIWQAADGTWQLWSCIGHTSEDGTLVENGQPVKKPFTSAIFCRASADLKHWSEPIMVSAGGNAAKKSNWYGGDAECPIVIKKDGYYYLFRNQLYGKNNLNTQYASANPPDFGVGHDDFNIGTLAVAAPEIIYYKGEYYIAALNTGLSGIRIARLGWQQAD